LEYQQLYIHDRYMFLHFDTTHRMPQLHYTHLEEILQDIALDFQFYNQ
jgi:hypothetical protein